MKNKFRSDLAVAKNLGSAKVGSKHWWYQRFTAIIMLLSIFWVFLFSWQLSGAELSAIIEAIKRPYNIIMLLLFILTGLYHAILGMQVVIEDYIPCRIIRLIILLSLQIFSIVTVIAFLLAVFNIMTL